VLGDSEAAGPYLSATRAKPAKRVERKRVDQPPARRQRATQTAMRLGQPGEFQLPSLSMLNPVPRSRVEGIDEEALEQNARLLQTVLAEFGVVGDIVKVRPGPVV
jgi:S-DNA-T family DNA segregation ATPase FtsK/SpoIIIE